MRKPITAVVAVTLAAGVLTAPGAAAAPADRPSVAPTRITLVTGDQVLVSGADVRVLPARRDRPVPIRQYVRHGDQYVLPGDAAGLVRAGRLDEQLFNVTGLLRQGYDDARTPHIPLLVRQAGPALAARTGVTTRAAALGYTALDEPKSGAAAFWNRLATEPATLAAGGAKVWLNAKVHTSLDQSVPQIGAPAAWQASLTGRGVPVAVLDTGIAGTHPDLAGHVVLSKDFTGKGSVEDGAGHGTHVASTIAGTGAASGGKYKGVAPEASLAVGKVLDDYGDGTLDMVLAGMQWAAAEAHARVVNMSLGGGPSDGTDPLSEAVNTLSRQYGTLFVVAAGNFGSDESVSSPAAADAALAVASVSKKDVLSPFSSRGPRIGDGAAKPDVAAPGEAITAAWPGGGYQALSGTSMATPHVAGSAAILAQQHPDWTADRLKAALTSTADQVDAGPAAVGTGRVDVARATATTVTATGSASAYLPWPNRGMTKKATVTWYNSGATPVTLTLGASVEGVSFPASVTVPAGGSTPVELTFTAQDGHPGTRSGILTASGDGVTTRTALSLQQEAETYDLTVGLVDRDGKPWAPTGYPPVTIIDLDTGALTQGEPGTFRLPRGRYVVNGVIETPRPGQEPSYSFLTHPELVLDHPVTQTLDARDGKPVSLEPDNPAARGGTQSVQRLSRITSCACVFADGFDLDPRFHEAFAATVPGTSSATFAFSQERRATEPDLELTADDGQPFAVRGVWLDSAAPAGTSTLPVLFGGGGTPEDLAGIDARGKLVVVRLPLGIRIDEAYQRLVNVENAGAKLGVVTLDGGAAGTTVLGGGLPTLHLPVVWGGLSVTARRFTELAKTGHASATVVSRPFPRFRYELGDGIEGQVAAPRVQRPKTGDLAEVRTAYHDNVPGEVRYVAGREFFGRLVGYGYTEPVAAQQERVEYYSPGKWDSVWTSGFRGELTENLDLAAGKKYQLSWNKAVAGPSLRGLTVTHTGEQPRPWAWRKDGVFDLWLPLFGDAAGRPRKPESSAGDTGSVTLTKDGVAIPVEPTGEPTLARIPVPDADGGYRLTAEVHRHQDWWPLWTDVAAEWGFRSAAAADGQALPLLTVRFAPAVDLRNSAPAGRVFTFPAFVERQGGGTGTKLAVEVSTDDGRTWQPAPVLRTGDHWTVAVRNPAGGFVSLRASAADERGNTVRQTVIRAYAVG
ncbi:subtilisin family serine protease [Amycolatopsis lexingtonensis]|uniref:Subtilisin family serine protease n=2 Tax=Amycolatopsis lexingtonensis TaxID=218822 RepID=A0ABR9I413_9PSEU|nr:S8 family serine peptidase [Amycolatopsis lexingtonensis]MBE1497956.1 subtilisin family serine protease [Amycolatopsis lexingtonensis]